MIAWLALIALFASIGSSMIGVREYYRRQLGRVASALEAERLRVLDAERRLAECREHHRALAQRFEALRQRPFAQTRKDPRTPL